jgi:antitoxin HicB
MSTCKKPKFDHSGSSFDSFLEEEGLLEEVNGVAVKRVSDWQAKNATSKEPPPESA